MQEIGRMLFMLGIVLVVIGAWLSLTGKIPFFGKLPGDILIKRDNFTFYAPVATSIILSIILTLIIAFLGNFRR